MCVRVHGVQLKKTQKKLGYQPPFRSNYYMGTAIKPSGRLGPPCPVRRMGQAACQHMDMDTVCDCTFQHVSLCVSGLSYHVGHPWWQVPVPS